MGIFEKVSDSLTGMGKNISSSTQQFVNEAKLQAAVREKKNTINEALLNLGKAYYTAHVDDTEGEFIGTIEAIRAENKEIEELKKQISDLHGKSICPKCGAEIEKDAAFCPKCGANIAEERAKKAAAEAAAQTGTAQAQSETTPEATEQAAADRTDDAQDPTDAQ